MKKHRLRFSFPPYCERQGTGFPKGNSQIYLWLIADKDG